jgi:predicted outer membrane repeat protein
VYGTVLQGGMIARNTISNNHATDLGSLGGGIHCASTDQIIQDNSITGNNAGRGGGVWFSGSNSSELRGNTIVGNTAIDLGGGAYISSHTPKVLDNLVADNTAGQRGGGIYSESSSCLVEGCIVVNNSAGVLGGGVYFHLGSNPAGPVMRNLTVADNTGTGAVVVFSTKLAVDKSILAFNSGSALLCFSTAVATVSCSDLYGNVDNSICGINAGGNFSLDPLFLGTPPEAYGVDPGSPVPAINSPCQQLVGAVPPFLATSAGGDVPAIAHLNNFPNPFNPTTTIRYGFEGQAGNVSLAIYDVHGARVRTLVDEQQSAGVRTIEWNGRDDAGVMLGSGVYFCRITAPGVGESRRLVLLK